MYCPTCGASVDNGAKYCATCGAPTASNSQELNTEVLETEVLSNAYEKTGRLDESSFTPIHENVAGGVPIHEQQQPFVQQPHQSCIDPNISTLDEKGFYKQFASKNTNGWVIAVIIACFLTAAASIPSLALGNLLSVLDVVFYLVFGMLLLLKKKWYFALPITIYSGVGTLLTIVATGAATGIFALIAGIASTIKLKKFQAAYKQYKECGVLPQKMI